MAPAGGVICKKDIAGSKAPLGSIADLDFTLTGQVDHVLAPGRHMPILDIAGRRVTENDALSGLEFPNIYVDFFKVRFTVRSAVDSYHFHDYGLLE
jgi:hypothetical protein